MRATIIGAGAFGTAMAQTLASADISVFLGVRREEEREFGLATAINEKHRNAVWVRDAHALHRAVRAAPSFEEALNQPTDIVFWAVASQYLASVLGELPDIPRDVPHVILSKGFCVKGDRAYLPVDLLEEILRPNARYPVAVLAGPTFSSELLRGEPSVIVGGETKGRLTLNALRQALSDARSYLRMRACLDRRGIGLCSALKTAYAIGGGILFDGGTCNNNARAMYVVSVLAEMAQLIEEMGGRAPTVYGPAGLGDFFLTALSEESRNFLFGGLIAHGMSSHEALAEMKEWTPGGQTPAVEGLSTLRAFPLFAMERFGARTTVEFRSEMVRFPILDAISSMVLDPAPVLITDDFLRIVLG